MFNRMKLTVVIILIFLSALLYGKEGSFEGISHIYAFGDSSIDSGRGMRLSKEIVESQSPPENAYIKAESNWYWNGNYSNGKVFPELISDYYNARLTNYAVGGAKTGPDPQGFTNWSEFLPNTGGVEQINEFTNDMSDSLDPKALYIISIGGNDTYNVNIKGPNGEKPPTLKAAASKTVKNISQMIQTLIESGGEKIIVNFMATKPGAENNKYYKEVNKGLTKEIERIEKEYDVGILSYSFNELFRNIEKNKKAYGYKTLSYYLVSDYCHLGLPTSYGLHRIDNTNLFGDYGYTYDGFIGSDNEGLWEINQYLLYDEYHFTAATHKHMFDYIIETIDEYLQQN